MDVFEALARRRSVRGFEARPVPREVLERIFGAAQRAPSWCNIQPWRVVVTSGERTRALGDIIAGAAEGGTMSADFPWPGDYPEPYGRHRKECGVALYSAMGVARGDLEGRHRAWMRNFRAFGAPHIAMVGVDRRMMPYAAIDLGCWLQSVLLAATAEGVATCAQAALATQADAVRPLLGWDEHVGVIFGIAMGYEDTSAPVNGTLTTRSPLADNVRFDE
jgi:nitroreductase